LALGYCIFVAGRELFDLLGVRRCERSQKRNLRFVDLIITTAR
jgi:hypothetical protein